jgi:hypothetical protein
MAFIGGTSTSAFLACSPTAATTTVFTTSYVTELAAACPTSSWTATYTCEEVCTGNPAEWTQPAFPNGFVVSTVECDECSPTEIVITCPGAQNTQAGQYASVSVWGNGVTAVATASAVVAPAVATAYAAATAAAAASAAAAATAGSSGASSSADSSASSGSTGSTSSVVTAGAPSMKRSLAVLSGLFFVAAGPLLLL